MTFPESEIVSGSHEQPAVSPVMGMAYLVGAQEPGTYIAQQAHEARYNNLPRVASLRIGLGCAYMRLGDFAQGRSVIDAAVAAYVLPYTTTDFKMLENPPWQQSLIIQARIGKILRGANNPSLFPKARRGLHDSVLNKLNLQEKAAQRSGRLHDDQSPRAWGRVWETEIVGLMTRVTQPGAVATPSLEHEGRQSNFPKGENPNYDLLLVKALPGTSRAAAYRTEIKSGCLGYCAKAAQAGPAVIEKHSRRFEDTRDTYRPNISLISACCDVDLPDTEQSKGITVASLLRREANSSAAPADVAILDAMTSGILDTIMNGPGAGEPEIIELPA